MKQDIYENIRQILVGDPFNINPTLLHPELSFSDLAEWESMLHLTFLMELERKFDITISSQDMGKVTSIQNAVKVISNGH